FRRANASGAGRIIHLVNGLLYIDLERVIPEAKKPRRSEINSATPREAIDKSLV
ncbi:hypothetical protein O5472_27085, partial [Escherichia coli]|nr:hypothetical protein [Escherichia coli]